VTGEPRRRLADWLDVAGLLAAVLAVAVGAVAILRTDDGSGADAAVPATSATTTSIAAALREGITTTPAAAGDARVVVLGDSVTGSMLRPLDDAFAALRAVGQPIVTVRSWTVAGFGLGAALPGGSLPLATAPDAPPPGDFAGWRDTLAAWVESDGADVVVLQVGLWDTVARTVDGEELRPGIPQWRTWYRGEVEATASALTASGAHVVWLQPPCVADPVTSVLLHEVGAVVAEVARARADTTVLPLHDVLCPGGGFTAVLSDPATGAPVAVRAADGIHAGAGAGAVLTPWFAARLAPIVAVATSR
jgi:hypothetical protein